MSQAKHQKSQNRENTIILFDVDGTLTKPRNVKKKIQSPKFFLIKKKGKLHLIFII